MKDITKISVNLLGLALTAFICIYSYSLLIPKVLQLDGNVKFFPLNDFDDVRNLLKALKQTSQSQQNWIGMFFVYSAGYLIKQGFAIPGSALLNVLAGALYGHLPAWILVNLLTATGSTWCYFLSKNVIFLRKRVLTFNQQAVEARQKGDLFWYMLFIRMFPFTPNWLINIASPHVGVPVYPFFMSMLIGTSPYSFITTGAGEMISDLNDMSDVFKPRNLLTILVMAVIIITLPILKDRYVKNKKE